MAETSAINQFLNRGRLVHPSHRARLDHIVRFLESTVAGTVRTDFHCDLCDYSPDTVCYRCKLKG